MLRLFINKICNPGNRMMSEASRTTLKHSPPLSLYGIEGRYVSALYSAASQLKLLDETEKNLNQLKKILLKPKIIDFLETSIISRSAKAKLFQEIGKSAGINDAAINFLVVVAENGRLKMLRSMITKFHAMMVAHRKEAMCEVITAQRLDDSQRSALLDVMKKFVNNKKITLTERVDEKIIGGMIVGIENKHIDLSIARKIQMYTDILKRSV